MALALDRSLRSGRFVRIGHKGAAALAPENTIESIAVALDYDVDLVEVDVVDAPDGTLVLAHSHEELEEGAPTLEAALRFFAAEAPPHVGIDLDLKWYGFEDEIVAALSGSGLTDRALVSSFFPHSLRKLGELEPRLRTGISYPWDRHELSLKRPLFPLVVAGVFTLRTALPYRIEGMVRRARAQAAMLHYSILSRPTVRRCHLLGVPVFAWTIDEPALLERILGLGVDGVISNDPRIFNGRGE